MRLLITGSGSRCGNAWRQWSDYAVKSPEVQRDFSEFLASLNAARARYLVVGAYALAAHGSPRNTLDLDVFVQPTIANGRRLVRALGAFGFGSLEIGPAEFARPDRVLQLGRQPLRIDVLTSITGVSWAAAWNGRFAGHYGDVPVYFLGREELLINKRATGRAKDLGDVDALSRLKPLRRTGNRRR
jgi:hypothetical protein